jgi:hypothetical protein
MKHYILKSINWSILFRIRKKRLSGEGRLLLYRFTRTVIKRTVWLRKEVIVRNCHWVWYTREISALIEMYLSDTYSNMCTGAYLSSACPTLNRINKEKLYHHCSSFVLQNMQVRSSLRAIKFTNNYRLYIRKRTHRITQQEEQPATWNTQAHRRDHTLITKAMITEVQ